MWGKKAIKCVSPAHWTLYVYCIAVGYVVGANLRFSTITADRWAVIWLGGPIEEITPFLLDDLDWEKRKSEIVRDTNGKKI